MSKATPGRRLIVLEFNELCPDLLQRWMAEGALPNFKKFHDASQTFVARAETLDPTHLEPWIQWYSLHTGLSFDQHGVFHLTDGPAAGHADVWQALLGSGYTVASCASMNVKGIASPGSLFLPDPWCASEDPYPAELSGYQAFVRSRVQENTNSGLPAPGGKAYLDLLTFLAGHGLGARSVTAVVRQLFADSVLKDGTCWKRAALLDKLQFDIFRHYWAKDRYDFSTFFLNSTAHFQHAYWHLAFPESFPPPSGEDGADTRRSAILFGYQEMDRLLARFAGLERKGAMLVLSTALSQQPNPKTGSRYYRALDIDRLVAGLGVSPARLLPVMAHQYSARFGSAAEAERARAALGRVKFEGRGVFEFVPSPEDTVFFGNALRHDVPEDATLEVEGGEPRKESFYKVFYKIPHTKSGVHHPDSVLWFKTGTHRAHPPKVSILDVMPTVLDYFGVPFPSGDGFTRAGRSLLPSLGVAPYRRASPARPLTLAS